MASMAASDASNVSKETKPKPRELPESPSRIIFGVDTMTPNAEKVSYSSFSSTSRSRLPTKMLAPDVDRVALLGGRVDADRLAKELDHVEDLDCILGVRHRAKWTKPKPMCCCGSLSFGMCTLDDQVGLHAELP